MAAFLVNLAQQLAAHAFFACLTAGHHAPRRGQDVDSHSAQHAWNLAAPHIHAAARARHTLRLRDRRLVLGAIFTVHTDDLVALFFRCFVFGDIAFLFQNAGNLQLQARSRNIHLLVPGRECISHSRQHICDRIGQPHRLLLLEPLVRSAYRGEPAAACSTELATCSLPQGCHPERDVFCPAKDHYPPLEPCHPEAVSCRDAHRTTTKTSKPLEFPREAPAAGNTSGKCRTCAEKRADVRTACSGCACAWKTWVFVRP